jgi:hypothetical protein
MADRKAATLNPNDLMRPVRLSRKPSSSSMIEMRVFAGSSDFNM